MSGMNFSSHGSQDLFPTMLTKQIGLNANERTITMIVVNLGAIVGGMIMGQLSEITGRRLSLIICCIIAGALIYPTFFAKNQNQIMASGFFMQASIMGSWGILPIYLIELSPPEFRSLFGGLAYQLGNLVSSASATIEADATEKFPLPELGPDVHDYGKVMALFMTGVLLFLLICVILGPEKFHRDLTAGADENDDINTQPDITRLAGNDGDDDDDDKGRVEHFEGNQPGSQGSNAGNTDTDISHNSIFEIDHYQEKPSTNYREFHKNSIDNV